MTRGIQGGGEGGIIAGVVASLIAWYKDSSRIVVKEDLEGRSHISGENLR